MGKLTKCINLHTLLLLVPLLFICLSQRGLDHQTVQWKYGFLVFSLPFAICLYDKFRSIPLMLCFLSTFFSANYLLNDSYNIYAHSSFLVFKSFQASGASTIATLLLFAFTCYGLRKAHFKSLEGIFGFLGILNAVIVIIQGILYGPGVGRNGDVGSGFFSYAGMNACFIACVYPFSDRLCEKIFSTRSKGLLFQYSTKMLLVALVISSLIVSQATIPFGVFFVSFLAYELSLLRREILFQALAVVFSLFLSLAPSITTLPDFWGGSSRLSMYQDFMGWWFDKGQWISGMGQGSFENLSLPIQKELGKAEVKSQTEKGIAYIKYDTMHSDWIQLLFEQGIIGFIATLFLVLECLKILWKRRSHAAFGVFLAFNACAVLNYPLHIFVFSFLGAFLVGHALLLGKYKKDKTPCVPF